MSDASVSAPGPTAEEAVELFFWLVAAITARLIAVILPVADAQKLKVVRRIFETLLAWNPNAKPARLQAIREADELLHEVMAGAHVDKADSTVTLRFDFGNRQVFEAVEPYLVEYLVFKASDARARPRSGKGRKT